VGFFNVNVCSRTLQLLCCQQLTAGIAVKYNEYKWKGSYSLDASHWPNTRTKYFEPSKAHSYRREKRLLASSCLSVRPSIYPTISALLPMERVTWNLMLGIFVEIHIQMWLKSDTLHEDLIMFYCCRRH
jgi:hypothetical protein